MSAAIRAQIAALRAGIDALEASIASAESREHDDPLLGLAELRARYGVGRASVLAAVERGELTASRGARGKIQVRASEAERWATARPVTPRQRADVVDIASWDAAAQLRVTG
jgi:hypothetical protein